MVMLLVECLDSRLQYFQKPYTGHNTSFIEDMKYNFADKGSFGIDFPQDSSKLVWIYKDKGQLLSFFNDLEAMMKDVDGKFCAGYRGSSLSRISSNGVVAHNTHYFLLPVHTVVFSKQTSFHEMITSADLTLWMSALDFEKISFLWQ